MCFIAEILKILDAFQEPFIGTLTRLGAVLSQTL